MVISFDSHFLATRTEYKKSSPCLISDRSSAYIVLWSKSNEMFHLRISLSLCLVFGLLAFDGSSADDVIKATCVIAAGSGIGNVSGNITLTQTGSNVTVKVDLVGFPLSNFTTKHGFHVHQSGNLSDKCNSCGPHFNPYNVSHGSISDSLDKRHAGDLGNIVVQPNGTVSVTINDTFISLLSSSNNSILGRGIVVHAMEDDLGKTNHNLSSSTGNAGGRLGCCTVTLDSRSTSSTNSSPPKLSSLLFTLLLLLLSMLLVMAV